MCGICAIITPYNAQLQAPTLTTPTPDPSTEPVIDHSQTTRRIDTPPNVNPSDLGSEGQYQDHPTPLGTLPTLTPSSCEEQDDGSVVPNPNPTHLTQYAAQFKYHDARPRRSNFEAPYTEIQRPRPRSTSMLGSREQPDDEGGWGETGTGDLRDEEVEGYWVRTEGAERAVEMGQDPVGLLGGSGMTTPTSTDFPTTPTTATQPTTNGDPHDSTPKPPVSPYRKRLEGELLASLETIAHRGPDGKGVWVGSDCRVALGHVR